MPPTRSAMAQTFADLLIEHVPGGLELHGCCDAHTATSLGRALDGLSYAGPVDFDLADVTFADSRGLLPLAEAVRRARATGAIEPRITAAGPPVLRVLGALNVALDPFGLDAWDAAAGPWGDRAAVRVGRGWAACPGGQVSPPSSFR